MQAEASNHPLLLCSRDMVVSELGKGGARPCQVGGRYDRDKLFAKPKKDIWLRILRRDWKRTLNR